MSIIINNQDAAKRITEAIGIGETLFLAQKNACDMLGVDNDRLDFEVLQLPEKKKFGIFGGREAKVLARMKTQVSDYASSFVDRILSNVSSKNIDLKVTPSEGETVLDLSGDGVSEIISEGENLVSSIQYLTSLVVSQKEGNHHKIKINAEGLDEKRRERLKNVVLSAVNKAKKTGRKVELDPMTSYERLIVHQIINEIGGIKAYSKGEGRDRHIVIEVN